MKRDLATGATTRLVTCASDLLPAEACGTSYAPGISDNGAVVSFVSTAALDPSDPDAPSAARTPDPYRVAYPQDVYVFTG